MPNRTPRGGWMGQSKLGTCHVIALLTMRWSSLPSFL